MNANKPRGVYWLTIEPDELHREKVFALESMGFEVSFFQTLDSLTKELKTRRVTHIIVGDEGPEVVVLKAIALLNHMPDIHGAKLILSCSRYSPTVLRAAACDAFRDILPICLNTQDWVERFIFSTGHTDAPLTTPATLLACDSPSSFSIPARVVWMSPTQIWLESRIFPEPGTRFTVTGPIAQSMGVKGLEVEVLRTEETNLTYRFSMALICTWEMSDEKFRALETLSIIEDIGTGRPIKTFLAVQSPALRASLIRHLDLPPFETRTALQRKSLVTEPQYFCPQLVIIEDRLTSEQGHYERFSKMAKTLPADAVILIIGDEDLMRRLSSVSHGRTLRAIKRIPVDFRDYVLTKVLDPAVVATSQKKDATYIPSEHEFSLAELKFPAVLKKLHPAMVTMAVPHPVGAYGLARVESDLLEKVVTSYPYAKIARTNKEPYPDSSFPYIMECYFCDVSQKKRQRLAKVLSRIFEQGMQSGEISDEDILINFERERQSNLRRGEPVSVPEVIKIGSRHEGQSWVDLLNPKYLLMIIGFLILTLMALVTVTWGFKKWSERREPSGKVYTDQLKIFKENQ